MKNRFQIKSFIIATFFLVAYLNVFAKQASCNLSHYFEETESGQHHSDDHHASDQSTSHQDEDHDHHPDEKSSKKDNGCCNDKTSSFFASQGNPITSSIDFKNTSCTRTVFINSIFVFNNPIINFKGYVSYSLPPPKIPDIRVFIQSFII